MIQNYFDFQKPKPRVYVHPLFRQIALLQTADQQQLEKLASASAERVVRLRSRSEEAIKPGHQKAIKDIMMDEAHFRCACLGRLSQLKLEAHKASASTVNLPTMRGTL